MLKSKGCVAASQNNLETIERRWHRPRVRLLWHYSRFICSINHNMHYHDYHQIPDFHPCICILHGKNTMDGISKYKCPRNKLLYSTEAINCFLLTQWMLDVTDKGIINHVLAYSNSANAKQFSYRHFVVLWRPQLRNVLGLKLMMPCKIRG